MANNSITLTINVNDDGSLKVVAKNAKSAASALNSTSAAANKTKKSLNNTNKVADNYNKQQKAIYQSNLSSAKGFSKMNQTMGGSSGLVASYAVLASNIFAATAAFNALRQVAQVEQLAEGLQFVGNVAGRNLKVISDGLKEVSGNAISTAESMRTVAIGISAGFSGKQLQDLTKVAKGASIALGRDMGDAISRLTRGVAKLEPEILDELGILVRLDTATQVYAAQMGVAVTALTQFDRQQAFMNATLEQGLRKYGDIADAIDPNAYDQLAAAMGNIAVSFGDFLNKTLGLSKIINFLADNMLALTAVATTLTLSLTKGIAPGMFAMAQNSAKSAKAIAESNEAMVKNIKLVGNSGTKYTKAAKAIKEGARDTKLFAEANNGLSTSIRNSEVWLKAQMKVNKEDTQAMADKRVLIAGLKKEREQLAGIQKAELTATSRQNKANSIQLASNGKMVHSFKALRLATSQYAEATASGTAATGRASKALIGIRASAFWAAGAIRAVGAAFFAFLPYIGLFISVGTALYAFVKDKWFPEDIMKKRIDEIIKSFDNFTDINEQFASSSAEGGTRVANAYITYAGVLEDIKDALISINKLRDEATHGALVEAREQEILARKQLQNILDNPVKATERKTTRGSFGVSPESAKRQQDDLERIAREGVDRTTAYRLEQEKAYNEATIDLRRDGHKKVLDMAIERIKEEASLGRALDQNFGGPFAELERNHLRQLEDLRKKLKETTTNAAGDIVLQTPISAEEFLIEFAKIQKGANNVRDAFLTIDDSVTAFSKAQNKLKQKTKGPYDEVLKAAEAIENKFKQLDSVDQYGKSILSAERMTELTEELGTNLKNLRLNEYFGKGRAGVSNFIDYLKSGHENLRQLTKDIKVLADESKTLAAVTKDIYGGNAIAIDKENEHIKAKHAFALQELDLLEKTVVEGAKGIENAAKVLSLKSEIAELDKKIVGEEEKRLLVAQSNLRLIQLENTALNAKYELAVKLLRNERLIEGIALGRGARLTKGQEYKAAVAAAEQQVKLAEQLFDIEVAKAEITFVMTKIQLDASTLEKYEKAATLEILENQLKIVKEIAATRVKSAKADVTGSILKGTAGPNLPGTKEPGMLEIMSSAYEEGAEQAAELQLAAKTARDDVTNAKAELQYAIDKGYSTEAISYLRANLEEAAGAVATANLAIGQSLLKTSSNYVQPMIDSLRKLGPEGEFGASIIEGAFSISSSIMTIGSASSTTQQKLEAVGNMIGAVMQMYDAKSKAVIAGYDKEIAAEKKRDGASAASIAKIRALEKKQEAAKRKQFEVNKKMMMAQTIINTAAAIMMALGQLGPIAGAVMAALIGTIGAAQLAIIAGTSFEGGGSAGGGMPTSVAVGERGSTIDLAKSRSPSGELAYARGERGMSEGQNYVPAFTGRASGGNAGLIVGEQGPELFIPERPGTVVPADEVSNTGGNVPNINFNINTIDSQGMEEALHKQQDHIIRMIREAANAHGEFFLEAVT